MWKNDVFFSLRVSVNRLYPVILIIFIAAFCLQSLACFQLDRQRLYWGDTAKHLENLYDGYTRVEKNGLTTLLDRPFCLEYPPLLYYFTLIWMEISGVSIKSAVISQWVFVCLLGIFTYITAARIMNPEAGFLCAVVTLCSPLMAYNARQYMMDLPLSALVLLAFYLLIQTDGFENRFFTILFGAACGAGVMLKTMFPIYVLVPSLIVLYIFLKKTGVFTDKNRRTDALKALAVIPAVIVPAYCFTLWPLIHRVLYNYPPVYSPSALFLTSLTPFIIGLVYVIRSRWTPEGVKSLLYAFFVFTAITWHYYGMYPVEVISGAAMLRHAGSNTNNVLEFIKILTDGAFGVVLAVAAWIGLCFYSLDGDRKPGLALAVFTFVGGMVLLYVFPIKDHRYFLPLTPFAAIIAVNWIMRHEKAVHRAVLTTLILYFIIFGWVGWNMQDTFIARIIPPAPANNADLDFKYAQPPPFKRGYGEKGLADCIWTLKRDGMAYLVIMSRNMAKGSKAGFALPLYLEYQYGYPVDSYAGIEGIKWDTRDVNIYWADVSSVRILSGEPVGKPEFSEESRGRNIITVYIKPAWTHHLYPPEFIREMDRMNMPRRPDLVIMPGPVPGDDNGPVDVIITRIPMKSAK